MISKDSYFSISAPVQYKFDVKGSRFLADAYRAQSLTEIKEQIARLKKAHYDATHICYAWRIGLGEKEQSKAHDAGEPKHSAGEPILNAIKSAGLTDILVTVTRWVGGSKLGKANLTRTYRECAAGALALVPREERFERVRVSFDIPLGKFQTVARILKEYKAPMTSQNSNSNCTCQAYIPKSKVEEVIERLREATSGKVDFN